MASDTAIKSRASTTAPGARAAPGDSSPEGVEQALKQRWDWLEDQGNTRHESQRQTIRDLEDDGQREDEVRQAYTGRYPLELLQNAHDACQDKGVVGGVEFTVTESALLVANEGAGFDRDRVISLTRHGWSEKLVNRALRHTIGYKGVGFISVFEISDLPQVIARDFAFGFDKARARREVARVLVERPRSVPARYFPFQLTNRDWVDDAEVVDGLLDRGYVTVVRLPFRGRVDAARTRRDVERTLTPELLLFLEAIKRVTITGAGEPLHWEARPGPVRKRGRIVTIHGAGTSEAWIVARAHSSVKRQDVAALRDPLWEDVRRLNVAVALPWQRGAIVARGPTRPVHVYFPTDDHLGRRLLIHGDFYVDKSRRRIEAEGPAGALSRRVGEVAAATVARLASSEAESGRALLETLAPDGSADGFGRTLGDLVDAELAETRIARRADGARPRRPRELTRIASGLDLTLERRLLTWLDRASDLLLPGDDAGSAGELLESLGMRALPAVRLAARLAPRGSGAAPEEVLHLLHRWLLLLPEQAIAEVVKILRERPIVVDADGRWREPNRVVTRTTASLVLPKRLGIYEVLQPRSRNGRSALAQLKVPELTASAGLRVLLDGLESRRFGNTASEKEAAFDFAWRLWKLGRQPFANQRRELGIIEVPARKGGSSIVSGWRPASKAYFGRDWSGSGVLEAAYGPLGEAEFIASAPPRAVTDRSTRRRFLEALGVSNAPRLFTLDEARSSLSAWSQWLRLPEVDEAWACPQVHPDSPRRFEGTVLDRLDDLLDQAITSDPRRLVAILLTLGEPYGPSAAIRCANAEHGGKARRNPTVGYQRWRLESVAWVPTTDAGVSARHRLEEAWFDLPARRRLRLPRATLRREACQHLDLVRAGSPKPEAVVTALTRLAASEEQTADVFETANWLLGRLDRSLTSVTRIPERPPFPAKRDGLDVWAAEAVVPDLPGLTNIPGLEMLRPNRWRGLRRAYDLPLASEVVSYDVEHGAARKVQALLPVPRRAQVLAGLYRRGLPALDADRLGARLARLREYPVEWLQLRVSVGDGESADTSPPFHLRLRAFSARRAHLCRLKAPPRIQRRIASRLRTRRRAAPWHGQHECRVLPRSRPMP